MLRGKVALVTGAASGLGMAFCYALAQEGATLAMVDINRDLAQKTRESLQETFKGMRAEVIPTNVADRSQLKQAFDQAHAQFGRLDIVLNNAGIADEKSWERMVAINLTAVIDGTYLAFDAFRRHGNGGVVVNTASMGGLIAMPFAPVYAATKHGVVGFSRSFKPLAKAENIRVNALCPSFADTPLVAHGMKEDTIFKAVVRGEMGQELLSPALVAEGMLQLVTNTDHSGAVMRVTKGNGIDFQKYGRFQEKSSKL